MGLRTDLIMENEKIDLKNLPEGVDFTEDDMGNVHIQELDIKSLKASVITGKPVGKYITFTVPDFGKSISLNENEKVFISEAVKKLIPDKGTVMVAGLGNRNITADALGIKAADNIIATRHLTEKAYAPLEGFRSSAVITTGVLGQTGIETAEMIKSVAKEINPSCIVVIDALAAASVTRLGTTIQVTDTGISPGSGVQNRRSEISRETMGIPVIAVGIPTVVDSDVIVRQYAEKQADSEGEPFMVSPRNIDLIIERGAQALSIIINMAIQDNLGEDDIKYLIG